MPSEGRPAGRDPPLPARFLGLLGGPLLLEVLLRGLLAALGAALVLGRHVFPLQRVASGRTLSPRTAHQWAQRRTDGAQVRGRPGSALTSRSVRSPSASR